jgi:hypothetical protein
VWSWHKTSDGRFIVDKWDASLQDVGQREATRPLRYDVLYVCRDFFGFGSRGKDVGVSYMRFWPGGQFHFWWGGPSPGYSSRTQLTAADGDDFSYLGAGRYCVRGDKLVVEGMTPSEDWLWKFEYFKEAGDIEPDGSIAMSRNRPFQPDIVDRYYFPERVGEMKRQPDWPAN